MKAVLPPDRSRRLSRTKFAGRGHRGEQRGRAASAKKNLEDIEAAEQLETHLFYQHLCHVSSLQYGAGLHLKEGSIIINTTSVTGLPGTRNQMDTPRPRGGVSLTWSTGTFPLLKRGIRVDAVAPGPSQITSCSSLLTPEPDKVETFNSDVVLSPLAGEPNEECA